MPYLFHVSTGLQASLGLHVPSWTALIQGKVGPGKGFIHTRFIPQDKPESLRLVIPNPKAFGLFVTVCVQICVCLLSVKVKRIIDYNVLNIVYSPSYFGIFCKKQLVS